MRFIIATGVTLFTSAALAQTAVPTLQCTYSNGMVLNHTITAAEGWRYDNDRLILQEQNTLAIVSRHTGDISITGQINLTGRCVELQPVHQTVPDTPPPPPGAQPPYPPDPLYQQSPVQRAPVPYGRPPYQPY